MCVCMSSCFTILLVLVGQQSMLAWCIACICDFRLPIARFITQFMMAMIEHYTVVLVTVLPSEQCEVG